MDELDKWNEEELKADYWTDGPLKPRMARCFCGHERPSDSEHLAFFEFRGEGSRWATELCECGYTKVAHTQEVTRTRSNVVVSGKCKGFVPRGPHEFDSFYCGCRGWD